ncbi:hypothetical protein [Actinoplanes sp. TFC3]|uniref:hypothetical protein n=1 Tax=Actinoplanes sp. TFC3 TaxID=1710355 RepID=UPI0012903A69|nr:hypothetical protein [Actinoplanes sp. TFC3]
MTEKGGPGYEQAKVVYLKIKQGDKKAKEVQAACHPVEPETYEDRQLRTDLPAFKDNQREFYKCAQRAGYKLTAPDPETGQFGLTEVGPLGDWGSDKMQECRRESFKE